MTFKNASSSKDTCNKLKLQASHSNERHNAHTSAATIKILRVKDVCQLTGFSRQWIYELIRRGEFPKPAKIGLRAVGWDSRIIEDWIINRLQNGGEQ